MDCLFCNIIQGNIPSTKVYEDEDVFAFLDINPQAPVHVIIVPKDHIASAEEINESNFALVGKCFKAVPKIAAMYHLDNGYRVINNCGEDGGQTIMHFHLHLLGGTKMSEKIL